MVNSIRFDSTVNAFGDLVAEVFSGINEEQKIKLRGMLNHFTKISIGEGTRKPDDQINNPQAQEKKMTHSVIHDILPPEMVEKILKLLNYRDICKAQLTCRRWKEIIDNGNLVKKASGRISKVEYYLMCIICVLL